ncbi:MAG TPA: alpha/beta hydrolase, partial [Gemmatimonadales bacterium]|nr:alpha/beta hydrolase [Gemmatimonadales bacterium]
IPVTERKLTLAAIDTPVLVGGDGPPVVLLHGPAANALHWRWMIPGLVRRYGVVAPDLPGHGDSTVTGILDAERVFLWLAELIEHTCPAPPTLVGNAVGGAIAARFAARFGDRIRQLVLVDTMGFAAFDPAPAFGTALQAFLARPTEATHDELWRYCAHDLPALQARTGRATWKAFSGYNLDRVIDPAVMSAVEQVMAAFGLPAITPAELARIRVPTTVIWGRYDLATPLIVAEVVAARYGWSLEVIENCADDPPVEQPERLLAALLPLLGGTIRT